MVDDIGTPVMPMGELARNPRAYTPDRLAEKIISARAAVEGERKHLTVLFADVARSMELAESTDPEEWQLIVGRLFAILCEGVHRFEGTVDKFTGDGIMALFGAPLAHEDHAARACHAALYLREKLAAYSAELRAQRELDLSVRIGINSGEVITGAVGDDLTLEYTAIGHTVGLAERMQSLAEPGAATLSEHTAALIAGYFDLRDLGALDVKGAREPVRVYELTGLGSLRTALEVSRARGFSRFVGRNDAMVTLASALARAQSGSGQVVGVVAEAGMGKSRLCHEFAQACRMEGIEVLEGHGKARGEALPLLPVLEFLRAYFGITEYDTARAARQRIEARTLLLDDALRPELPLVFDLLGVTDPVRVSPRMDPEARQRRLFGITNRLLTGRSRRTTGVIVIEDLQWIDSGSEAFVENLVGALPTTRTLLIVNFRPEYRAAWMASPHYRRLPLSPLSQRAVGDLLHDLLGDDPTLDKIVQVIGRRAGGNPFFVEELARGLAEEGTLQGERGAYRAVRTIDRYSIPATVQAVLAARVDRLADREKVALQAAAVIGRDFAEPVLRRVAGLSGPSLGEALEALVAADLLRVRALVPTAEYSFTHHLTVEVVYGSQLAAHRAALHAEVARAIQQAYPDSLDEMAALVADHLAKGGEQLDAARWSARAAGWAGSAAPREALRHWHKVRELTDAVEHSEEAVAMGIAARIFIVHMNWRLGVRDEEERVFREGRQLARRSGDRRALAALLGAHALARNMAGEGPQVLGMSAEALRLAEECGDTAIQMVTLVALAWGLYTTGRLREARAVAERGIELCADDPALGAGPSLGSPYAWCVWLRGHVGAQTAELTLAETRREAGRALRLALAQGDVEMSGWAHMLFSYVAWIDADGETALTHANRMVEIAERLGGSFSRGNAYGWLGQAQLTRGDWDQAVVALERSLEISHEAHTGLQLEPWVLSTLAAAHLGAGNLKRAQETAELAVEVARERGTMVLELGAQLHRARVKIAATGANARSAVEADLERARALIEETGAKVHEPLLHEVLARLALIEGDGATADRELRDAQRLLEAVGASSRSAKIAAELAKHR